MSDSAIERLCQQLAKEGRAQLAAEITGQWARRPPADPLMTIAALADFAGVPQTIARRWISDCGLPAYRTGRSGGLRVRKSDFESWLAARRTPSK